MPFLQQPMQFILACDRHRIKLACTPTSAISIHTYTHLTALFPGLPGSASTRKVKPIPNLDFNEARDSEWQWHQLGRMQVCTSLQTDNHASTPPLQQLAYYTNSQQKKAEK